MNFHDRVKVAISFSRFSRKVKVIELNVVLSANINLHVLHLLRPKSSLYDLQKRR